MNHLVPDDTLEATGYLDPSGTVPGADFDTHLHRRLFFWYCAGSNERLYEQLEQEEGDR